MDISKKRPREVDGDSDADSQDKRTRRLIISNLQPAHLSQLPHQNSSLKQRKCTNLISPTIPNGKTNIAGSTVTILKMACFAGCAKRVGLRHNQQKEPGPHVAWRIGTMQQISCRATTLLNGIGMQSVSRMAEQAKQQNVLEMQLSVAAKEAEKKVH